MISKAAQFPGMRGMVQAPKAPGAKAGARTGEKAGRSEAPLGEQPVPFGTDRFGTDRPSLGNAPSPAMVKGRAVQRSPSPLRRAVNQVLKDEDRMERLMRKALRGRIRSMEDLLNLQVTVYRYAQQAEVLSKMVDRATQAVKQTLQTPL